MNIKELDETTIKAFLYDLILEKENIQNNINMLQNELSERARIKKEALKEEKNREE